MPETITFAVVDAASLEIYWQTKTVTATYSVMAGDVVLLVDASSAAVTINLPVATNGRVLVIKVIDATNSVTIDADSTNTIDGSLTKVLSSLYDSRTLVSDGTDWHIIGVSP